MVWKGNFLAERTEMDSDGKIKSSFDIFTIEGFMENFFQDSSFTPKALFELGFHLDEKHFPKHIIFGNFQCLRCGLCCKNCDGVQVRRNQIIEWQENDEQHILSHVHIPKNGDGETIPSESGSCPFCRKVRKQPIYSCYLYAYRDNLPICKGYLCNKSLPVAHINYSNIEELIRVIGLNDYYSLIERDWNEAFDYVDCEKKTHRKLK